MRKLLPLIFLIVAGATQGNPVWAIPPMPGYPPPPGYGPYMPPPPQGYYPPPSGYYPPPPGYYPPPPGYYPAPPPEYYHPPTPPPGYAMGPMPDYYYPPMVPEQRPVPPEGFPAQSPPEGMGPTPPSFTPPTPPPAGPKAPGASTRPPSAQTFVPLPPEKRSNSPAQPPAPLPSLPPPSLEQAPGAGQEPPLLPAPAPPAGGKADLPPPGDVEQTPIPDRTKGASAQPRPSAGILGWFTKECTSSQPGSEDHLTDHFPRGAWTVQTLAGFYQNIGSTRYQYIPLVLRVGKLIDCPVLGIHGCLEPIVEVNFAPSQFGSTFAGAGALLRYNFIDPTYKLVPYIQAGAGAQANTLDRDFSQTMLGQALAYTGQFQVGMRWLVCKNVSFDVEAGYMVFSNLHEAQRSDGVNALGASIGLTYYFPMNRR